jgi:hypothetical protein
MSDPLRTDPSPGPDGATGAERDAKIEQLLLVGLDHYFAAQYEQAINVWTRALFLDRSHARARAYIERARTALAERLRESEELFHDGVAALQRGEGDEARRLLEAAMHRGAPPDEALAVLDRLNRLSHTAVAAPPPAAARDVVARTLPDAGRRDAGARVPAVAWVALGAVIVTAVGILAAPGIRAWVSGLQPEPPSATAGRGAGEQALPVPRRGETALARARALAAGGRLHDALTTLDLVRPTDPERAAADRLRGEIQQQLVAVRGRLP